VEARYDYLYSPAELAPWAERSVQVAESGADDVYAITNNHYQAKAAVNAIQLRAWYATSQCQHRRHSTHPTRISWLRGHTPSSVQLVSG
jgi:uncharacterized protein YecE (DUF72 family)